MTVGHTSHAALQHNWRLWIRLQISLIVQCSNEEPPVAKPTVVTFPTPEFKLPTFDLDALFASQTANLAAVHEAQSVLTGAAQAIAKVQYGYLEQAVAAAKAALASKELPKPEGGGRPTSQEAAREGGRGHQGGRGPRGRRAEARLRGADPARPGQRRRAQGGRRLTPVSARRGDRPGISGHLISAVPLRCRVLPCALSPPWGHRSY